MEIWDGDTQSCPNCDGSADKPQLRLRYRWDCTSHRNKMEVVTYPYPKYSLRWRQNGRDSVSNHQPHDYLLNRLFRRRPEKNIKAPRHWPLCGDITADRWIPRTNGQWRGKCFHLMMSSCIQSMLVQGVTGPQQWGTRKKSNGSSQIHTCDQYTCFRDCIWQISIQGWLLVYAQPVRAAVRISHGFHDGALCFSDIISDRVLIWNQCYSTPIVCDGFRFYCMIEFVFDRQVFVHFPNV